MYRGLQKPSNQRIRGATKQQYYGLKDYVHIQRLNEIGAEELYYGPPRPGQSFSQFQSYMSLKNLAIGSGIAALAVINPIVGVVAGIGWLLSGPEKTKNKAQTQGG